MSASACVSHRGVKRFTITAQPSKLNKARVTVSDSVACITSSYSYATAQELVKELAGAVGMLVCTPETMAEMVRAQHLLMADTYD
jgi:prophage DNA circulation protein